MYTHWCLFKKDAIHFFLQGIYLSWTPDIEYLRKIVNMK